MPLPPDTMTVQGRDQARLLLDEAYSLVLECTMQGQASASDVARRIALPLQSVHHRLTKLVQAGLVQVVGEKRRHGRPIKLYGAAAPAYRIPLELTEAADLEDTMRRTSDPHWQALCRASAQVFRDERNMEFQMFLDSTGRLSQNLNPSRLLQEPIKPTYGVYFTVAMPVLKPATLEEAEVRLRDFTRWLSERMREEQHDPHATPALVTLGFAPVAQER